MKKNYIESLVRAKEIHLLKPYFREKESKSY